MTSAQELFKSLQTHRHKPEHPQGHKPEQGISPLKGKHNKKQHYVSPKPKPKLKQKRWSHKRKLRKSP